MKGQKQERTFLAKLRDKYRLIIVSDSTFEERVSLKLSRLNVISIITTAIFLIALVLMLLIMYTGLKELIPGYSDAEAKKEARKAINTAERLEADLTMRENYMNNVMRILKGEMKPDDIYIDTSRVNSEQTVSDVDFKISQRDSALRAEVSAEDMYNLRFENVESKSAVTALSSVLFFTPLRGEVSSSYDIGTEHLGVDVVAPDNETIKAALDGTVIFSSWTSNEGYVIAIQHSDDLVSIYKHNSVLLKKSGEMVQAGESVAIIGNSGELTDGPHLHFELWYEGEALDPEQFILFE